jgi:hypothetical protein
VSFSPPEPEDLERLAAQRAVVDELARAHVGRGLAGDDSDLLLLQALVDAEVIAPASCSAIASSRTSTGLRG